MPVVYDPVFDDGVIDFEISNPVILVPKEGGGVGTYKELPDKPKIEGVTLEGDKSAEELKIASKQYVDLQVGNIEALLATI